MVSNENKTLVCVMLSRSEVSLILETEILHAAGRLVQDDELFPVPDHPFTPLTTIP